MEGPTIDCKNGLRVMPLGLATVAAAGGLVCVGLPNNISTEEEEESKPKGLNSALEVEARAAKGSAWLGGYMCNRND